MMSTIINIILWLASLGVFSSVSGLAWFYIRQHVKSTRAKSIGDIALQAVTYAEKVASSESGEVQNQIASKVVNDALKALKLDKLFTPEQVAGEIEIALLKFKQLANEVTNDENN